MCLHEENLCANFRPSHEVKNCTEKNMLMVPKLNLTNTLSHTRHAARLQKSTYLQLHNFICSFRAVTILYIHTEIPKKTYTTHALLCYSIPRYFLSLSIS